MEEEMTHGYTLQKINNYKFEWRKTRDISWNALKSGTILQGQEDNSECLNHFEFHIDYMHICTLPRLASSGENLQTQIAFKQQVLMLMPHFGREGVAICALEFNQWRQR